MPLDALVGEYIDGDKKFTVTATKKDGKDALPLHLAAPDGVVDFTHQTGAEFTNKDGNTLKFTIQSGAAVALECVISNKKGKAKRQ